MKKMSIIDLFSALVVVAVANAVNADEPPFYHDVFCKSKNDQSSVRITQNKSENPTQFGPLGAAHIEIYTGDGELIHMAEALGVDKPVGVTIERSGPILITGNRLSQDIKNPFVVVAMIGFTNYQVLDENGVMLVTKPSFLSTITLSKINSYGYANSLDETPSETEYTELKIFDDFGEHYSRFNLDECSTLN